jgi:ABC-type branched-subunit amino acid transport system substrate-binding protein
MSLPNGTAKPGKGEDHGRDSPETPRLDGRTGALIAGYSGSVRAQSKPVALGVSAPITGDMTQYGIDIRQGVELAVSEINKAPPRCPACR